MKNAKTIFPVAVLMLAPLILMAERETQSPPAGLVARVAALEAQVEQLGQRIHQQGLGQTRRTGQQAMSPG